MRQQSSFLSRAGYTMIELLIVVVLIGVLAAIALPKFGAVRDRARVSTMKSDLRNLATVQEVFRAQSAEAGTEHYGTQQELFDDLQFNFSEGNGVQEFSNADLNSYKVILENSGISSGPNTCSLHVGEAARLAGNESLIQCPAA